MRFLICFLLAVIRTSGAWCQSDARSATTTIDARTSAVDSPTDALKELRPGDVSITLPANVEALLKDYTDHEHPQNGYRVQIFLGDRKTAEETKRTFLQKNPDIPTYLSWLAPNFRLRVGDLRTRLDAERLLNELKEAYPGSYIVPDEIGMPRVE